MAWRIIFPEKGRVAFEKFSLQSPGATDVRVRTLFSLMSIGTETTILAGKYAPDTHFARMFSFPQLKTGVQAVGIVEEVGTAVSEFGPGDRIFMRMAHGSEQVLAAESCTIVPDAIDAESACWCGLAKTAFRAAWAAPFTLGASVLIIGAGPVGQMAVRWATTAGVGELTVVDLSALRLEHASRGGATRVMPGDVSEHFPGIASMADGKGPEIVVDATGHPPVFQHALAASARFGKVLLLGDTGFPAEQRLSSDVMTKGLTIQATHDSHERGGWSQRRVDRLFFDSVQNGTFDPSGLITHRFSPGDCDKAYALAIEARQETMGILFDWSMI